jgi:diguanylate cyclase (GGDEF)-like protein
MAIPTRRIGDWLRRQSASRRLRWAFGILLGLLLLVALLSALRLQQQAAALTQLSTVSMTRLKLAADISAHTDRASRQLLTLITGEREQRVDAYRVIDDAHQRVEVAVVELRELLQLEGRRLAPLGTAWATYRGAYDETVDLIESGDLAATRSFMASRTEASLAQLSLLIEQLVDEEQSRAMQLAEAQRSTLQQDMLLLGLVCFVALLAGTLLARTIRRSITVPLQRTEAIALRIATGDYAARAQVRGHDEVAGVAKALNTLAEAVATREAEIRRLADTDAMTGLAQRGHFLRDVGERLVAEAQMPHAMVCLDVERLKTINALAGFEAGDAAISSCAERLRAQIPAGQPLARLGGGGFGLLLPLPGRSPEQEALQLVQRLRLAVETPFVWLGESLDLNLALGVALHPLHAADAESLLRRAEQALFEAKRRKSGPQLYSPLTEQARQQDLSLATQLQQALALGQLQAFLQPKVQLTAEGTECIGAEALIRWQHPQRGFVSPADFIPFAERTGRIRALTQWMLERVIGLLAEPAFLGLKLAINLSTQDLHDPLLDERLRALLVRHQVDPARLTLELTESGLMEPGDDPVAMLQRLKDTGVRLAIDDFGTGHSSLAYLQRLPVDELKIDRSFVRDVDLEPRRYELLATIVQLGHNLGLSVTAEGVEREAELEAVRRVGCELVQGYFTGRPMAVDAFIEWRAAASRSSPASSL